MSLQLPILTGTNAFFASNPVNRALVEGDRNVQHLEVTLPEGQRYQPGDHLGVYAYSPKEVSLAYFRRIKMDPESVVKMEGESLVEGFHALLARPTTAMSVLGFAVE